MERIADGVITECVDRFLGRVTIGSEVTYSADRAREYSWDFAFNYFQDHPRPTESIEFSCMQLGYYLASWGMLRGSSYLFNKTNARHYTRTIEVIEKLTPDASGIDADRWSDPAAQEVLLECYARLRESLLPPDRSAVTLVTKVMLGVWGNVPAYDTYFQGTFRSLSGDGKERSAANKFDARSLTLLGDFYQQHAEEVDALARGCRTRDFATFDWTERTITRAKVVDMFGFQYTTMPTAAGVPV